MIKCNVTVCGTVSKVATCRTNKEGKAFVSFAMNIVIPAKSGINKTIEVSVIKDGEEQLGTRTRVKVVKNKVAPPFKKAEFDIMFGEGISKIGEIIDLGVDYGIIKKSGSWFSYGDRKIGQGRDSVKELLKNDEALRNEVEAKVREAMIAARKA